MDYSGDKAELYSKGILVGDDFYNGMDWEVSLDRIGTPVNQELKLVVLPLKQSFRKYFDIQPPVKLLEEGKVNNISLLPQYQVKLNVIQ